MYTYKYAVIHAVYIYSKCKSGIKRNGQFGSGQNEMARVCFQGI